MCCYYKKESVRSIFIYPVRGSGIPIPQINNTPHSYLSTRMGQSTPIEESIRSDECVAFLVVSEIFQISNQGQKLIHFHQYMSTAQRLHYKFSDLFLNAQKKSEEKNSTLNIQKSFTILVCSQLEDNLIAVQLAFVQ